jgi:two-component system, OmpR family, phosphate regulon response regulator PhoB
MARILTVEDEADLRQVLEYNLRQASHELLAAGCGLEGLRIAREQRPDLIRLDLMLPDVTGLEVCRSLKADLRTKEIPVVMLTARGEEIDRLVGLELGADDSVVKPFSPRELLLRIGAILRRVKEPPAQVAAFGRLSLDRDAHRV